MSDETRERLSERVEQQRRQLEALAEIDRTIATRPDPQVVLERIVEEATKLMRADGAGLAFVRPGEDELEVGPATGVLEAPPNRSIPLHGSITGRAVRTGRAELIRDVTKDPEQYPLAPLPVPTRSAVVAPLRTPDELLGGLIVVRGPDHPPFDVEQRDALQHFADQAAIAIDQARLVDRLREANRVKEEFLATLSHELRTPLTGILLWTDMLKSNPGLEELDDGPEAVEVITQSAELLLSMVNDLLELGRIAADKLRLERQPVDLSAITKQALAAFRRRGAEAEGVVLVDELPERLPPVDGDPARIQQVISNLLSNAVKFTEAPGRVTVRAATTPDGRSVALEVEDTGVGIPAEFLPHVFERFRQGEAGPTRRHGGLGVGLTVACAIVEAHGGSIRIRSEEGRGSTFTVELPIPDPASAPEASGAESTGADSPARAGDAAEEGTGSAEPLTVLVAEDVEETRHALRMILEARGYRVLEACDGAQAVEVARKAPPAAVLMDVAMPGVDGITALQRLRRHPATASIPVAAVTARAMPEDQERVEAAGFDARLVKPFRIAELMATLRDMLDRRSEPRSPA